MILWIRDGEGVRPPLILWIRDWEGVRPPLILWIRDGEGVRPPLILWIRDGGGGADHSDLCHPVDQRWGGGAHPFSSCGS